MYMVHNYVHECASHSQLSSIFHCFIIFYDFLSLPFLPPLSSHPPSPLLPFKSSCHLFHSLSHLQLDIELETPPSVIARIGGSATINYSVATFPDVSDLTLMKEGGDTVDVIDTGVSVVFSNVMRQHAGMYTLSATNNGNLTDTATFEFIVECELSCWNY